MIVYDFLEDKYYKKLLIFPIKIMKICFPIVYFILILMSIIDKSLLYLIPICLICIIEFIGFLFIKGMKKMYGRKIGIKDNEIIEFSINGNVIKTLDISKVNYFYIDVVFPTSWYLKLRCLILCTDCNVKIYNELEFTSYWNNKYVMIVQNPQLIKLIEFKLYNK